MSPESSSSPLLGYDLGGFVQSPKSLPCATLTTTPALVPSWIPSPPVLSTQSFQSRLGRGKLLQGAWIRPGTVPRGQRVGTRSPGILGYHWGAPQGTQDTESLRGHGTRSPSGDTGHIRGIWNSAQRLKATGGMRWHQPEPSSARNMERSRKEAQEPPVRTRGHSRKGHKQFAMGGQGRAAPGSQDCQTRSCGWGEPWWFQENQDSLPQLRLFPCPGDVGSGAHP